MLGMPPSGGEHSIASGNAAQRSARHLPLSWEFPPSSGPARLGSEMAGHNGYYSLIQYCPDASRAEAANVGVLLFCPDLRYIDAKVSRGNDRIARFFHRGTFDAERINAAKQAIVSRLEVERDAFRTLDDLQRFIDTRANEIIVTTPRPVKVRDAAEDLTRLFSELVAGET